ncbi:MAG: hypothetical protein KJN63_10410, partial [Acidimicrobiia bacterium]|nr:hypothetical protein [Acidimicrobiia bacterium]
VLPSTMQHEQIEMNDSFTHYYLNWNEPAVEPAGECLPHTEIYRRLASVLADHDEKLADPVFQATEDDYARALLDTDTFRRSGITLETLTATGFARLPEPAPVHRFHFAHRQAEADGLGYLPQWRGLKEPIQGSTYNLIANGSDWHINTVFSQTAKTQTRTSAPPVIVCGADAARDGLIAGTTVTVGNQRGCFQTVVMIDDSATRPGVASITKGWATQLVNATVREEDSDAGQGAVYHDNRVTIVPS